ncbi:MAG: ATPase, partial [Oscillospiraceae bacterium]|nr:ATPase [Oscillospiraceae bacterium]
MKEYLKNYQEVMEDLSVTRSGLSGEEAKKRLEKNGKNKLREAKPDGIIKRFVKQIAEPMTIILIIAALIAGVMAVYEREFPADVIIIMAVVVINAVLGVIQESKAEKSISALAEMTAATSLVIRDGHTQSIPSEELVVGDIIILEAGAAVPADARIIECASMKIE